MNFFRWINNAKHLIYIYCLSLVTAVLSLTATAHCSEKNLSSDLTKFVLEKRQYYTYTQDTHFEVRTYSKKSTKNNYNFQNIISEKYLKFSYINADTPNISLDLKVKSITILQLSKNEIFSYSKLWTSMNSFGNFFKIFEIGYPISNTYNEAKPESYTGERNNFLYRKRIFPKVCTSYYIDLSEKEVRSTVLKLDEPSKLAIFFIDNDMDEKSKIDCANRQLINLLGLRGLAAHNVLDSLVLQSTLTEYLELPNHTLFE